VAVEIDGVRYSWTQPVCVEDWHNMNGDRVPHRVIADVYPAVRCCFCGKLTRSGIFVREDPRYLPYPAREPIEVDNLFPPPSPDASIPYAGHGPEYLADTSAMREDERG
jgi:hypothetical protein